MKRSLWCPRVQMAAIKPAFDVPELAARRLKLSDVDDVTVVENISVFTNKSISEVIAALLALCALEPSMPRTIAQTLEESFDARPARHVALVLSGLDVNSHTQVGDSVGGGAPAADAATATAGAAPNTSGVGGSEGGPAAADGRPGAADAARSGATRDGGVGPPRAGSTANDPPARDRGRRGDGGRAGSGGAGTGGGGEADAGDGVREEGNVAVEAAYFLRAIRQATAKRASRLAVRRAARTKESNAQKNSPTGVRAASGARKRRAVAAPSAQSVGKKPNKGATPGAA